MISKNPFLEEKIIANWANEVNDLRALGYMDIFSYEHAKNFPEQFFSRLTEFMSITDDAQR